MRHQARFLISIAIITATILSACSLEDDATTPVEQVVVTLSSTVTDTVTDESAGQIATATTVSVGTDVERCMDKYTKAEMTYEEALAVAQSSQCLQVGPLKEEHSCNENSGTWWIDLQAEQPGCNPACVVDANTTTAEVNWRCTGAIAPSADGESPLAGSTTTPSESLAQFDYSTWTSYFNEEHGYAVKVPPGVQPSWDDEGEAVTFEGPLVDDEHWPMIFIGHGSSDFFRPPQGTEVNEWVTAVSGQPGVQFNEQTTIAGLPTYHVAHSRSPQAYAADQYYFIRDGQMFSIVILHAGDKQDWQLYHQFLQSFSFQQTEAGQGEPVDGWAGTIGIYPPLFQSRYYFDRTDGSRWVLGATDDVLLADIAVAAWSGAQVKLSGSYTPLAGLVEVSELTIAGQSSAGPRNLSYFARPTASSILPADRLGTYHEWSAIDGRSESPWCEGKPGNGVGEWLRLEFPGPVEVTMLQLNNGYDYSDDIFLKNNRVKRATLRFSDDEEVLWEFDDSRGPQMVPLARAPGPNIVTTSVTITIDEVFPGTTYDDTCISELEIWGRPG